MISAFGARARAFAATSGELEAVITDSASLGLAYCEAIRRRELGQSFYAMVLYEEPRAHTTLNYAGAVLAQVTGFDARRALLDQLGAGRLVLGTRAAEVLWVTPPEIERTIGEFLSLGSGVLVRSYAEAARLDGLSARPRSIEPIVAEPKVPAVRPRFGVRPGVVIWAPDRPAAFVAWYACALAEFLGEVTCVTTSGDVPGDVPARFVSALDPQLNEIITNAQCIVCADPDDPGAAVAFARAGFGVAAPLASGAHEYVRDVVSFGLTEQREVEIAVKIAIGRPTSVRELPQPLPAPASPGLPSTADVPLVSIVIPTYNRREDLPLALKSLAAQTYPGLEAIVVNDGGANVDDIVAAYPFARAVNSPVNVGVNQAVVLGLAEVTGEYVIFLADDDALFPDHVERVMAAMLRSGAAVGHANTLMRYDQRGVDGTLSIAGYNAVVFNDSTTATEALVSTPIAGQSLIVRRDSVEAVGGYSLQTALADQELQLRLAGRYVFAYADALTNEWRIRGGKENFSARTDSGAELRKLYEELHPVPGRPLIEEMRRETLAGFAERPKGYIFAPSIRIEQP